MADWLAPFHAPQLTTEAYSKAKAEHVAEKGYTVTVPGLSDIIHIGQPNPMTDREKILYRKKAWGAFSPKRLDELKEMKWKKRQRYLAMLGSPTPEIATNAGSVLCAIDDAQDAISTIACVGRIAAKFAPRLLGRAFLGPIGWLLLANDILNLAMYIGQLGMTPMIAKRTKSAATASNPFSKKAKLARAAKLGKWIPGKGDVIQALQTTDQVFGFGICLGPIVGLAFDIVSAGIRTSLGQPVKFKWGAPKYTPVERQAQKTVKSATVLNTVENIPSDDIYLETGVASYLSHQALMPNQQKCNPLEAVDDLSNCQTRAPIPEDPLTLEIMEEEKTPVEEFTGWPHSGKKWANIDEISEVANAPAAKNLKGFVDRNQSNWKGYTGGLLACEASTYMLANLEGEEDVKYDYNANSKVIGNLLEHGYYPDPDQAPEKLTRCVQILEAIESMNLSTSLKDVLMYMKNSRVALLQFG